MTGISACRRWGRRSSAPKNLRALGNSLLLAMLVGVAGTLLGLIFAFTVERVGAARRVSRLIDFFTFLPLISPPFTTSIAFVFSFGPRGLITYELLGIKNVQVYGLTSTFAAETLTYFPIAYLALRPMLASISTGLEEAAFSLGSSRWHAFRTVTLPLVIPGAGQRLPAAVRMLAGGFRNAAHSGRQRLFGAPDRSLSADHRDVRPQGRRDPVAAAAGAGRAGVLRPGAPGRRPFLCHRHRQGRASRRNTTRCRGCRRGAAGILPAGLGADRLFLSAAVLRLDRAGVRRQPHADAGSLPGDFQRGPAGDPGHAHHRHDRHAARRHLRHRRRLSRRTNEFHRPPRRWRWSAC